MLKVYVFVVRPLNRIAK